MVHIAYKRNNVLRSAFVSLQTLFYAGFHLAIALRVITDCLWKTCGKLYPLQFRHASRFNSVRSKNPPRCKSGKGGFEVCYLFDLLGGVSLNERIYLSGINVIQKEQQASLSITIISQRTKMQYIYLTGVQYYLLSFDFQT